VQNIITSHQAVKRMRDLTKAGVLFSFSFLSYNSTNDTTDGFKTVDSAMLRMGMRNDQSDKADVLVGYITRDGKNRWFYLPLLTAFNNYIVKE
jgi:hypothetical protein